MKISFGYRDHAQLHDDHDRLTEKSVQDRLSTLMHRHVCTRRNLLFTYNSAGTYLQYHSVIITGTAPTSSLTTRPLLVTNIGGVVSDEVAYSPSLDYTIRRTQWFAKFAHFLFVEDESV